MKCLILIFGILHSQPNNLGYEQIAINFFLSEICPNQFKEIRFRFPKRSLVTHSAFGVESNCFNNDHVMQNALEEKAAEMDLSNKEKVSLQIDKKYTSLFSRYRLSLSKATSLNEKYFVNIAVRDRERYYSYYFVVSKSGEVVDWCKNQLVIS